MEDPAYEPMAFQQWQTHLAGIRDAQPLAKLPEPEQETCRKLWADVQTLLKRSRN
ncbi:MAG: hypothetical protein ACJ8FY_23145 [Gemmataceae bacterium]